MRLPNSFLASAIHVNTRKTERGAISSWSRLVARAAPFALLNTRKTERGAISSWSRLVARAAPFALLIIALHAADIPKNYATPDNLKSVIDRYLAAQQVQQDALRGARMEVDIDAQLPSLEKNGKLRVLRMISKLGKISFDQIGQFIGDPVVKKEVIGKYLELEQDERQKGSIAITPANYKFQINAIITQDQEQTYIFKLTPKRKAVGLFKGELWLDGATGMPLKESGQMVKSGSAWLKSIRFVRDYEMRNGISILKHLQSTVDVRVVGKAELNADYSNPTWQEDEQAAASPNVP
ncbi:MAG: hypothetical protein JWO19_2961 [Bryobacterales bacterium]|nr:hypothetical protein [Bryobacterales bacterium]